MHFFATDFESDDYKMRTLYKGLKFLKLKFHSCLINILEYQHLIDDITEQLRNGNIKNEFLIKDVLGKCL